MTAPGFDHHARLGAAAEPEQQAFVTPPSRRSSRCPVLPGYAWVDRRRVGAHPAERSENGLTDEFRAVIRTQVSRSTAIANQPREHFDEVARTERSGDIDGQTFAREPINRGEALQLLRVGAAIEYEVVGPDVIWTRCWQRSPAWQMQAGCAIADALDAGSCDDLRISEGLGFFGNPNKVFGAARRFIASRVCGSC